MKLAYRPLAIITTVILLALSSGAVFVSAKPNSLIRDEIPDEYKWDFTDIYSDWETWSADMIKMEKLMDEYAALQGTLSESPETLLKAYLLGDELGKILDKVWSYAALQSDTDTRDNDMAAKYQQIRIIYSKFNIATSWFNPEMLKIPWETMKSWLDENEKLAPYRFGIENLYRTQAHVLDEEKEKLLSYFGSFNRAPSSIYQEISTADIDYKDVVLSTGDTVKATETQTFATLRTSRVQADRAKIFAALYDVFNANINTYAAIYNGVLQRDWARAQSRNFGSCLEAALDGSNIPVAVYETLLEAVKNGTGPIKRYMKLRKEVLGLDSYHLYDGFAPLVEYEQVYDYNDACQQIIKSVAPLGKDYQAKMKELFSGRWIDVFENEGKSTGAYSAGVYGVHPYILLNFDETLEEVFTVAHEVGHALHTMLAMENQPFATAQYTTFVAEVASTMDENLFLDYMLKNSDDPYERVALLQQALDNISGTFYKQTFFAEFEHRAHQMVEQGQPITGDGLRSLYATLLEEYYGDALTVDEIYHSYWTRIGHFFGVPFYVFKYATSYSASAQIAEDIKSDDKKTRQEAVDKYLNLLKAGGNDYPMEQLKKAGVDMSKPETYEAVIKHLDKLVDQLEKELKDLGLIYM